MRTIGLKNRKLVKDTTTKVLNERDKAKDSWHGIEKEIIRRLPEKLWDTWEGCDQEIKAIIDRTIQEY